MSPLTQILSIDQGTTNSKAVLVADDGTVIARGTAPVSLTLPRPGWVEQDAEEIWASVLQAVGRCLAAGGRAADVRAVALSNQRESVLAWRRSDGAPLGPVIGWQDRRTTEWCTSISTPANATLVQQSTGLPIDAMFSAPKIRWLLELAKQAGTPLADVCVGTVDSWLIWKLTAAAEHLTEAGNASRTLLYDVRRLGWDDTLLDLFDVPRSVLPEVRASNAGFGRVSGVPGLPDGLPVIAVLADSHAALYGQGCTTVGSAKATYGTGSSVMTPTQSLQLGQSAVPSTLAWVTDRPTYAVEGNILSSGAALAWMANILGLGDVAALGPLAEQVHHSGGVTFVPAFSGLGAPHWDRSAVAQLTGMSQATLPAHLARAALEAVAHQVCDVVAAMERSGDLHIDVLRADGGATRSELLMQIQADLLGRPVAVSDLAEVSAIGAALLAWHTLGVGTADRSEELGHRFTPALDADARDRARQSWARAVAGSRGCPDSR
ncbi:FGGY-family carbohydrate kinase [Microlunatus panaciterrae]|uniref:ATP:glycerol 3-phosphotransferase n=1 Tax=Microlunatus panaciterrae TaxID=400768 RepID=A0ABS2RLA3_9ACTN|nr:FGGY family carbohydrate kinase [Microlunatus panaciterrae]MBM7798694.1 glycerol kinase [Microlunatus panaciterrae]